MTRASLPILAAEPQVLRTLAWKDHAVLDSGNGRKLERYGPYRVVRPEPQCLWAPRLDDAAWAKAHAVFDPAGEEDEGRWRIAQPVKETWPLGWRDVRFNGRL